MKKRFYLLVFVGLIGVFMFVMLATSHTFAANTAPTRPNGTGREIGQNKNPGVMGTVSSISGTNITLISRQNPQNTNNNNSETTYTIDASAATIKKIATPNAKDAQKPTKATTTISDIKNGDTLMVQGTVSGTSVVAKEITVGIFGKEGKMGNPADEKDNVSSTKPVIEDDHGLRDNVTSTATSTNHGQNEKGGNFWSKIFVPFKNFFGRLFK
jgi:hypothetical protein